MGHAFWKENMEERVKLLESIILNCCVKVTTADLRKVDNFLAPKFPSKGGVMFCTPLPPCPLEKCTSGAYFSLTGYEWSLIC